jgi:hypothetical protein
VVADEEGLASATALLTSASVLLRCAMASALWVDCGGVSLAEGWEECEEECTLMVSGLMLIGSCGIGELRTIVSPDGSIVSWLLELDSLPCISPASTCLKIGMGMAVAPVVLDLAIGTLAATVSCASPALLSSVLPCSWSLGA